MVINFDTPHIFSIFNIHWQHISKMMLNMPIHVKNNAKDGILKILFI